MRVDEGLDAFCRQLTLLELITFEVMYEAALGKKSLADISKASGRDIGGYDRTIKQLNSRALKYFGEILLRPPFSKGKHWTPTATGQMFSNFCGEIRTCVTDHFGVMQRSTLVRPIRIAMPQLPLHDMIRVEDKIKARLVRHKSKWQFVKQLVHIPSEGLPTILTKRPEIDFGFGGLIDPTVLDPALEFLDIAQRRYNLISNFDFADEYEIGAEEPITVDLLREKRVPLIIAHLGVIVDFLLKTIDVTRERNRDINRYLERIREEYNVVEECNDVHFLIELLCTSQHPLSMFGTDDIFLRAQERAKSSEIASFATERNQVPPQIFYHPVSQELPPLRIGAIRRRPTDKASRSHAPDHPYNQFWEVIQEMHQTHKAAVGAD